jgi:MinD superfamily P-loop ATPase
MNELVVISGKGGTGKTSLVASFAVLAGNAVVADCDVDAADLHLVLSPEVRESHEFWSGHEAVIREADCLGCGLCQQHCRFDAIASIEIAPGRSPRRVDPTACEGCGVCVRVCPNNAVDFPERLSGRWMVSDTRAGPMVHARLGIAADNSGKLVSTVRKEARRIAEESHRDLILVDGPPGIGCPVIASIGGASRILIVTEPTVSGQHDLDRVLALADHFHVPSHVCVNKWDLNAERAAEIEQAARLAGARVTGRIRYDPAVTKAQMAAKAVVETDAPSAADIRGVWDDVNSSSEGERT